MRERENVSESYFVDKIKICLLEPNCYCDNPFYYIYLYFITFKKIIIHILCKKKFPLSFWVVCNCFISDIQWDLASYASIPIATFNQLWTNNQKQIRNKTVHSLGSSCPWWLHRKHITFGLISKWRIGSQDTHPSLTVRSVVWCISKEALTPHDLRHT